MRIHDLITHFSKLDLVPVDPDDVARHLKQAGIRDQINYIGVNVETRILRGALHTYTLPTGVYSEPEICSDIYYASCLPRSWKRLVCCKELLHILDSPASQTATLEDFKHLMSGLCVHDFMNQFDPRQVQVWGDRLMIYYAMAIVFPRRAREIMLATKLPASLSLASVAAQQLDLPEPVATLVLSDEWPTILAAINGHG